MDINPENQFDFWLGEWEAAWGEDGKGTSHVERILEGKVVQEDFNAPDLHEISSSVYDPERKLWCQTWVDNNGTYLDFTGTFKDGKMILSRDAIVRGEKWKQRMVWYNIEESQFDWNWERSDDDGETWRILWQIKYTRKQTVIVRALARSNLMQREIATSWRLGATPRNDIITFYNW